MAVYGAVMNGLLRRIDSNENASIYISDPMETVKKQINKLKRRFHGIRAVTI